MFEHSERRREVLIRNRRSQLVELRTETLVLLAVAPPIHHQIDTGSLASSGALSTGATLSSGAVLSGDGSDVDVPDTDQRVQPMTFALAAAYSASSSLPELWRSASLASWSASDDTAAASRM